ncbi:MAG: FecR family protein [Mariprofundaceae bacterium]
MNEFIKGMLTAVLLLFSLSAYAQVGVVTEINGEVTLQRVDHHFILSPGVNLYSGDVIRSGENSSAQFDMDDGSMISISSNAEITVADYQLREDRSVVSATIKLTSGWLRFAISKLRGKESSFRLSMPTAVLGVRGTEGVIEVSGSGESASTQILLEEGEVEVAERVRKGRLSGQKIYLKRGQFAERKFGRILLKRSRMSVGFKKRLPAKLKAKLKQRIKMLKRRGIVPRKLIHHKIKRQQLKKRNQLIRKIKRKKAKDKKRKLKREKLKKRFSR